MKFLLLIVQALFCFVGGELFAKEAYTIVMDCHDDAVQSPSPEVNFAFYAAKSLLSWEDVLVIGEGRDTSPDLYVVQLGSTETEAFREQLEALVNRKPSTAPLMILSPIKDCTDSLRRVCKELADKHDGAFFDMEKVLQNLPPKIKPLNREGLPNEVGAEHLGTALALEIARKLSIATENRRTKRRTYVDDGRVLVGYSPGAARNEKFSDPIALTEEFGTDDFTAKLRCQGGILLNINNSGVVAGYVFGELFDDSPGPRIPIARLDIFGRKNQDGTAVVNCMEVPALRTPKDGAYEVIISRKDKVLTIRIGEDTPLNVRIGNEPVRHLVASGRFGRILDACVEHD